VLYVLTCLTIGCSGQSRSNKQSPGAQLLGQLVEDIASYSEFLADTQISANHASDKSSDAEAKWDAPDEVLPGEEITKRNMSRVFAYEDPVGTTCTLETQLSRCEDLVCKNGRCVNCEADADCRVPKQLNFRCVKLKSDGSAVCRHPPLFDPFDWRDISASIGIILVCFLSAASGIGGGGVLVPLYVLLRQMAPHDAVPLSKATTLGTAMANLAINLNLRHPTADRPLIDFPTCALLVPCQLMGTVIGVLLNGIIPEWLITVLLFVMLLLMTVQTSMKGLSLYRAAQKEVLLQNSDSAAKSLAKTVDPANTELRRMLEAEKSPDMCKLAALFLLWGVLVASAFIKGGPNVPWDMKVKCGTWQWWLLVTCVGPASLVVMTAMAWFTLREYRVKLQLNYSFQEGDVAWTPAAVVGWPLLCTFAGIGSGALGLGGGTVTSPIMLMMGMEPKVIAASAAFMILFTASSTTIQYLIVDRLQVDYAGWFCAIAFVSCLTGHYMINAATKGAKNSAVIIIVLAAVVGASAIGIGILGISRFITQLDEGANLGLKDLCKTLH
jgi:uncharacterized membrane protein YfcA